jgi:hypothetical protein
MGICISEGLQLGRGNFVLQIYRVLIARLVRIHKGWDATRSELPRCQWSLINSCANS